VTREKKQTTIILGSWTGSGVTDTNTLDSGRFMDLKKLEVLSPNVFPLVACKREAKKKACGNVV
jgi:hypothetical protein